MGRSCYLNRREQTFELVEAGFATAQQDNGYRPKKRGITGFLGYLPFPF